MLYLRLDAVDVADMVDLQMQGTCGHSGLVDLVGCGCDQGPGDTFLVGRPDWS